MKLSDLIPDPEALIAREPDEPGLRMLPVLGRWPQYEQLELGTFIASVAGDPRLAGNRPASLGHHPPRHRTEIEQALREAWAWLEGQALLIENPRYVGTSPPTPCGC